MICIKNTKEIMEKKEYIMQELRKRGFRITSQRKVLIDVILENECSCNKEIYYLALQRDSSVSMATVYRMVKTLEDLGAIDRKNMYRITCKEAHSKGIPADEWMGQLKEMLRNCGMLQDHEEIFVRVFEKGSEEAMHAFENMQCDNPCCSTDYYK